MSQNKDYAIGLNFYHASEEVGHGQEYRERTVSLPVYELNGKIPKIPVSLPSTLMINLALILPVSKQKTFFFFVKGLVKPFY